MSIWTRTGADRRAAIVQFVGDYWLANGYAPTVREVTRGCCFASTSTASHHLAILVAAGTLAKTPGIARSLRVVQQ